MLSSLQQTTAQPDASKWLIYGKYSNGIVGKTSYTNVGLTVEYQFRPYWTINWNLEAQARKDEIFQLHGSVGLIGGPRFMAWAISNSWSSSGIGASILAGLTIMVIPDGVSYHIPVGYRSFISPFVNVLGFDWVQTDQQLGFEHLLYSASAGVRYTFFPTDHFFLKGFLETRKAGWLDWNFGVGVALGFSFSEKSSD